MVTDHLRKGRGCFWESQDAIAAFAGTDSTAAKYYSEDEKYLLEFEPTVTHYELLE